MWSNLVFMYLCFSYTVQCQVGSPDWLSFTFLQYYQDLFRDGECFLHVVSLLNGNLETLMGEELVLNVLHTLTCLVANNDASKVILCH